MPTPTKLFIILTLAFLALSACQPANTPSAPTAVPLIPATSTPTSVAPPPLETLTVCLGEEPDTLYLYNDPNTAARSVLNAIYDGPIDSSSFEYHPVILKKIPSLADGDAVISTISVSTGDRVVDANSVPITLTTGARIRPAGCRADDCVITYDGVSKVDMEQMAVSFSLLPGLYWSDGKPMTSADSIFSYNLAANKDTPVSKYLTDRTQAYEATDDLSVQWWGLPGYIDPKYFTNFWTPLPEHELSEFAAAQLPETDVVTRTPTGWGPYVLEEWLAGEQITLTKNRYYFRSSEGLPAFDTLVFRFVADPEQALGMLLAGKCDLLDPSIRLDSQVGLLLELQRSGQVKAYFDQTMAFEQLAFGIRPATYDNGYKTGVPGDRPDYFSDPRTRQAISLCLDRQQVVDTVLYGLVDVANTFIPENHPAYNPNVQTSQYDPAAAAELLNQAGWRDLDEDPATPRVAQGAVRVMPGTPLVLNYVTTSAVQRRQVSEILSKSLQECGIGITVTYLPFDEFYAPGPGGVLFGRKFDLAEFAMGTSSTEPPCGWYRSSEIPAEVNAWVGTNVSGYNNPVYESACQSASMYLPSETEYLKGYQEAQSIYAEDVASIPLYFRLKIAASRPDLCGFSSGSASEADLWSLENIGVGTMCP